MAKVEIDTLKVEYDKNIVILNKCQEEVKKQIMTLLEEEAIVLGFPIQSRVKTFGSISEKLESERFNVKKSLFELQDLVGFRIILLFLSDAVKVADIIEKRFSTIKIYNTVEKLNENEFGYSSIHIVSKIPENWSLVPTLKDFKDIKFEIQIRTLSQHIWAEASNVFQYKNEQDTPKSMNRAVSRVSALLETIDNELERLAIEKANYIDSLITLDTNQDIKLDVDVLNNGLGNKIPNNYEFTEKEDLSQILATLSAFNIENRNQLFSLIDKHALSIIEFDEKIIKDLKIKNLIGEEWKIETKINGKDFRFKLTNEESKKRVLEKDTFFSKGGFISFILILEFGNDKVKDIIKKVKEQSNNFL